MSTTGSVDEDSMEVLLINQEGLIKSITNTVANLKKRGKAKLTPAILTGRRQNLQSDWHSCRQMHVRIRTYATAEDQSKLDYFVQDTFNEVENRYLDALDYINEQLEIATPQSSAAQETHHEVRPGTTIQLPRIELPLFRGDYMEWANFRDLFQSLIVDNPALSNVQKLQYLKVSLQGEALSVLSNLPITDANYKLAWTTLQKRYDNPRAIINAYLQSFFNIPCISHDVLSGLKFLRDTTTEVTNALTNLGRPVEHWSDLLVFTLVQRLDKQSRKEWETTLGESAEFPTFVKLTTFLETRIRTLEALGCTKSLVEHKSSGFSKNTPKVVQSYLVTAKPVCLFCRSEHRIFQCEKFKALNFEERESFVRKNELCFNCFANSHSVKACKSKYTCMICRKKHNTLLHSKTHLVTTQAATLPSHSTSPSISNQFDNLCLGQVNRDGNSRESVDNRSTSHTHCAKSMARQNILLATARVVIKSPNGRCAIVRAMLDQGSESSFLTESVAQTLKLNRHRTFTTVSGLGGVKTGNVNSFVEFTMEPFRSQGLIIPARALVLKKITAYLPKQFSPSPELPHLPNLEFADPEPFSADQIDLLIGADLYGAILREGFISGALDRPSAQNTIFGWVLFGPLSSPSTSTRTLHVHHISSEPLDLVLRKFWELEELPVVPHFTQEEKECENHFMQTHTRRPDGRFIVRLPFRQGTPNSLGESENLARASMTRLVKRFDKDENLAKSYREFINEYESLGHMKEIHPAESRSNEVYLPHHPVIRVDSCTTRLRVVFNASAPTSTGVSLNDELLIGRKLQPSLQSIILRWRQERYVFTADIAKMFRQILVDSRDQHFQCILWQTNSIESERKFQLSTVTYGTASAPFLSLRVLQQLATDGVLSHPLAAAVLRENMYVDEVFFGAPDEESARLVKHQVSTLLSSAGFILRKWASNHQPLLTGIDPQDHGLASELPFSKDEGLKVLGIVWNPQTDSFKVKVSSIPHGPVTKRSILSAVASLFDPIGWIAPVVIDAKMILQALWLVKIGWDEPVPDDIRLRWQRFCQQLPLLRAMDVPRWTMQGPDAIEYELHGFSDASNLAYAAVVYLRVVSASNHVHVSLLYAKTKVAPLKTLSIPKLELLASQLLSRAVEMVQQTMNLSTANVYCWTDSSVTLGWLRKQPFHWQVFVANRVSDVQTRLPKAHWKYVPSAINPADCASRGLSAQELIEFPVWWHGPPWLWSSPDKWPDQTQFPVPEPTLEKRKVIWSHAVSSTLHEETLIDVSSWSRLLRISAYVIRFVQRARCLESSPASLSLSAHEISRASEFWIKRVQAEEFSQELKALKAQQSVSKNSRLVRLDPFLDDRGIIRVGGRLRHSTLSFDRKFPALLPRHRVSLLIVAQIHLNTLHGGIQLTLRVLRERFWILGARGLVKSCIHQCIQCVRHRGSTGRQIMGDLPSARCIPSRPFSHTGVDYAGPFNVRLSSGRGYKSQKTYIAVFVCLCVRAIHIELVFDYSTSAFRAALDRFVARRGLPSDLYSDNGTNFKGAEKELVQAFRHVTQDSALHSYLADCQIAWHFSPPAAPHFGGIWEAGVKSVKHHLRRILGAATPTSEEFQTLLCRVESCLNSRPIAPLRDDPDCFNALTPGHFLIGTALTSIPEPSLLDVQESRLKRWQLVRRMSESFWRSWTRDYVVGLQERLKWTKRYDNLVPGELVLIKNVNLPPSKWELGRVIQCHPGPDHSVRVVTVKTARSEYTRPITQLCPLPVRADST